MAPPLLPHAERFLNGLDVAPRTVATYREALKTLTQFMTADGAPAPFTHDTLAHFRQWMRAERGYSRRTENTYLAGAVRWVEWLDAHELLPPGVTSTRMKLLLSESRGRRRAGYKTQPIQEAVPLLLEYYANQPLPGGDSPRARRARLALLRNRALVHTLFATAMRAHEAAGLRRGDCADGAQAQVRITGKGEKERVVLLNAEAQAAIAAYLAERDADLSARLQHAPSPREPLFVRHDRDRLTAITTKTVWLVVTQAARAVGAQLSISPHDFRRYLATTLLSEGMPLESVQAFLGHESIVTTRTVYAHTWSEVLADQVQTYRPSPAQAARRAHSRKRP